MKLLWYILLTCLIWGFFGLMVANASTRSDYKDATPQEILDDIVDHEKSDIVKTKLDGVQNTGIFWTQYKISGTLESIRQNLEPYLQWIAFLALAWAVALIVYNGLMLVISPLSPDEAAKVKTRMIYIATGVLLATWFYFVLKITLAIYYDIFAR